MRSSGIALAALLALATLAAPAPADSASSGPASADAGVKKLTLRYRFSPGETLRWDVVQRARITTTVSGTTQTAETVSQSVKAWRVVEVKPDGSATFDHFVESVDMSQKLTGREEVRYNSRKDAKPPYGFETVAGTIGKVLSRVTVNARGEVTHRERFPMKGSAESEGQITLPLPADPVAVGDTWTKPYELDVPLPGGMSKRIQTLQKFTLEEVRDGVAAIRVATTILTPVRDPAIESQLVQRESCGTVRFDVDAGRVIGQKMDIDKRVVGFRGEASSLHYLSQFTEEARTAEARTAAAGGAAATK